MATGGAGEVAALVGLNRIAIALTGIAVLQALLIPLVVVTTQRGVTVPQWRFGLFTVALGFAVIASDLQPFVPVAAAASLALAWCTTAVLGSWRITLMFRPDGYREGVDGTWFLAPAVLLGDASATAAVIGVRPDWTAWCATAVCLAGIAGYFLVIVASSRRLWNYGLRGSSLAPWWISAGCGGLAAAAAGTVAENVSNGALFYSMDALIPITWGIGTILLIVVLAECIRYARSRPSGRWQPVWTPVFSMAVYAAGTNQLARQTGMGALQVFALITIAATLALWAINTALSMWSCRSRLPRRLMPHW